MNECYFTGKKVFFVKKSTQSTIRGGGMPHAQSGYAPVCVQHHHLMRLTAEGRHSVYRLSVNA